MVIWRIYDGKPGHDNQSRGLVNALHRLGNCSSHDIAANKLRFGLFHYLTNKFPPGDHLPRPDLIIGAGHGTHMPIMCATHVYGGKSVVIMQPSLPVSWFDFCLAPDHDQPAPVGNVIITRGAINTVRPSSDHDDKTGLILVGGPSRHFSWNEQELLDQIRTILIRNNSVTWRISDSPRTPPATSDALSQLDFSRMTFHSWQHTGTEWVATQLARAGRVWVSSDSMSMIYEALTSGAATGVLSVPVKKTGRLARAIKTLAAEGFITAFPDWSSGKSLSPPPVVIDEATRCAALVLKNIEQGQYRHDK